MRSTKEHWEGDRTEDRYYRGKRKYFEHERDDGEVPRKKKRDTCSRCGGFGHNHTICTNVEQICITCNGMGHSASFCPNNIYHPTHPPIFNPIIPFQ